MMLLGLTLKSFVHHHNCRGWHLSRLIRDDVTLDQVYQLGESIDVSIRAPVTARDP